jgi:ABC-type transport system involved in cytochrome c biogenesis permease component
MSVPWTFADVKRHAIGVILIVALFAAVLALDPHKWTNDTASASIWSLSRTVHLFSSRTNARI